MTPAVRAVAAALALLGLACAGDKDAAVPLVAVRKQKFSRIVEADGYLRPVQATLITVPRADMPLRITWLASDGTSVKKGDLLARFDDLELRGRLADGQSERAIASAKRAKESLQMRAASHDRARATRGATDELTMTRTFQRRDNAIFSRDQIVEAEIDEQLQQAKVVHAQQSQTIDRRLGGNKVALIDVEARKAEESIRRAAEGLQSLEIRSPHDGVFALKRGWDGETQRVGDTAWRGQPIGELSRVEDLEAELFVLEVEAAGLAAGRRAEVVVEAQPGRVFAAKVKRVETVAKRRQRKSPTQYFGVVLTFDKAEPALMKPGQSVRARLFLHEQSALVLPRPALHDRDGRWVAFRRDPAGGFSPVTVKIGSSTAGLCTIESGLAENDLVAMRDPGRSPADLLSRTAGTSTSSRSKP